LNVLSDGFSFLLVSYRTEGISVVAYMVDINDNRDTHTSQTVELLLHFFYNTMFVYDHNMKCKTYLSATLDCNMTLHYKNEVMGKQKDSEKKIYNYTFCTFIGTECMFMHRQIDYSSNPYNFKDLWPVKTSCLLCTKRKSTIIINTPILYLLSQQHQLLVYKRDI